MVTGSPGATSSSLASRSDSRMPPGGADTIRPVPSMIRLRSARWARLDQGAFVQVAVAQDHGIALLALDRQHAGQAADLFHRAKRFFLAAGPASRPAGWICRTRCRSSRPARRRKSRRRPAPRPPARCPARSARRAAASAGSLRRIMIVGWVRRASASRRSSSAAFVTGRGGRRHRDGRRQPRRAERAFRSRQGPRSADPDRPKACRRRVRPRRSGRGS